ncbi:MAG TPA: glutaredoxin family protein [Dehalococcoidia bacterium]|nr:glutaredoxin family protein [Dehalococcoidia bacterium]
MSLISRFFRRDGEAQQGGPHVVERPLADPPAVTVYTTGWCASCFMAKRYLQQKGVAFREIDIERVPGAAREVMNLARGYKTVPTFIIGESVVVDWDQRAVASALTREGLL